MTDLQPEALIADARAATELDDFGADDFREGLDVLCASLNADAQLNELGRTALPGMLVGSLSNRLKVVDWIASHPEVGDGAHRATDRGDRHVPRRDHAAQPPVRPGSAQPRPAHVGGGRQRAAADTCEPPVGTAGRRGARGQRDAGADQPDDRGRAPRAGRRSDRVHHGDEPGLQEPHVRGDRQRARLRPVAARRRSALRVRVPPLGAAGTAERGRARPVDAEEPAPRDRARVPHRGVPRRTPRAAAPRPRRAHRVGVQPDQHAVVDVQRRRPPPRTSPSTGRRCSRSRSPASTPSAPRTPSARSSTCSTPTS